MTPLIQSVKPLKEARSLEKVPDWGNVILSEANSLRTLTELVFVLMRWRHVYRLLPFPSPRAILLWTNQQTDRQAL